MTAYDDLMAHARETEALAQVAGRLGWDQETVMPRGAAAQRGEESAAMEGVLHARRTDPRIGDWLAAAQALDAVAEANLREVRRAYERANKVPAKLAAEIARVTSVAQGVWAEARATEDVAAFLPTLRRVVALRQEEGQALAQGAIGVRVSLAQGAVGVRIGLGDGLAVGVRVRLLHAGGEGRNGGDGDQGSENEALGVHHGLLSGKSAAAGRLGFAAVR